MSGSYEVKDENQQNEDHITIFLLNINP